MKIAVNLRSDLAKLSDAELANHLKENWQIYEAAGVPPPGRFSLWPPLIYSFRGPVRHRRAYRFLAAIGCANEAWLALLFATLLSSNKLERLLRSMPEVDAHLSLCEIRDIMDEINRRLEQNQRSKR